MPPIVPFKKNTVVVCAGKPATAPILLFTIDEVRKIDDSYVYSLAAYKHPYNKDCWIPHSALAEVPEVPEVTVKAPLYEVDDKVLFGSHGLPFKIIETDSADGRRYRLKAADGETMWADVLDIRKTQAPLYAVGDVVMYRESPCSWMVARTVGDEFTGNVRYHLESIAGGKVWCDESALRKATPTQIGTHMHAKMAGQIKLDETFRTDLAKALGVNPNNDTIINAVVKHRDALTRATNELAELRRRLSWTLNSKNDDASIFTKIDHIKNLAFNPAKYRIGDEVVVKSGTGATLTRIKEVVPLDNGLYHYQLEMKIAEKYAVVIEEDIRLFAQRA